MKFLIPLSLMSTAAIASDFESRVQDIQRRSQQIESMIGSFGGEATTRKRPSNRAEETPLIAVHSSDARLVASAGDLIFGRLHTKVLVSSEPVPVLVEIFESQGVFSGLRAVGIARSNSIEGRVGVALSKLILRGGKSVAMIAQGLDSQGAVGLKASVISSKALAVAGALGSSFVAGLAAASQSQKTNAFGFTETPATGRNAVLQGLAQTAADQSKWLIEEATSEKPVLVLEAGTELSILIEEEIRL